jgi:hypothetical protein
MPVQINPQLRTALLAEKRKWNRALEWNAEQLRALTRFTRAAYVGEPIEVILRHERSHILAQLGAVEAQLRGETASPLQSR